MHYIHNMGFFIISFFKRKKKQQRIVKLSIISLILLILLLITIRIVDYFTVSTIIQNIATIIQRENGKYNVSYSKNYNIFTSTMKITDFKVSIEKEEGGLLINKINIKKTSGFLIPNAVSIVFDEITSINVKSQQSVLKPYNGSVNINVMFEKHFFKPSKIRGIKIMKPIYADVIKDNKKIANLKVDESIFEFKNNNSTLLLKQHGSFLLFEENIKDLFIIKSGQPFKWDIDMVKTLKQENWGINNEHTENVLYIDIKNLFFDYGYASILAKGTMTRDTNIRTANMEINIDNEDKILSSVFNIVLQYGKIEPKMVKQLYLSIKNNIIPMLKLYSNVKEKNKLSLKIMKTEDDELKVNNIALEEIIKKIDVK